MVRRSGASRVPASNQIFETFSPVTIHSIMKRKGRAWVSVLTASIVLLTLSGTVAMKDKPASPIRVITYNIRYAGAAYSGPVNWNNRKAFVRSILEYHEADIIGMQEVMHSQLMYFDSTLKDFAHAGIGRDDGKQAGEYSPVFFKTSLFENLRDSTFWLSPAPSIPARGWDAALPRVCTWVELKDRRNGKTFFVFNTHFDHVGVQAREESARLILRQIQRIAGASPVILTGDFNSEEDSKTIRMITGKHDSGSFHLPDAMSVSKQPHHGSYQTFCGFEVKKGIAGGHIDYIFVSTHWRVDKHATLTDFEGDYFPSDHFPVLSEMELKP